MPEVIDSSSSQVQLQSGFHFKLPVFEGPLDLLLHLIKENKIDIYDIPIAQITHQYIEYLELMKELNLEIVGEFLVIAATLIHIKSRMLLPPDEETTDKPAEDPRAELVERLLEHQAFKSASTHLREREDIWKNIFHKGPPEKGDFDSEPDPLLLEVSVFDLLSAFKKLLEKVPEQVVEITRETLTVADKINFIMERLEKENGIKFQDLFIEDNYTMVSFIVTFLALLELIRLGLAKAYQEKEFSSIWIINPQEPESTPAEMATASTSAADLH